MGSNVRADVLLVGDDRLHRDQLSGGLGEQGLGVSCSSNRAEALSRLQFTQPDVIVCDYLLPDGTALSLLEWLKAHDLAIPVIVIAGHANIDLAVQAVKKGAETFVPKPVDLDYLTTIIRRTTEKARSRLKDVAKQIAQVRYDRSPFCGESAAILELREAAMRVREANSPILIQGETGTGKGVLARWLYNSGPRSNGAFIDLNCAGLPGELLESELFGYKKGAFTGALENKIGFLEAANHGTLFLDELGDMDRKVQAKMLKVVEEKRFYRLGDVAERAVDVQIIAATHRDLKKLADKGEFRLDLYFRISALRLRIPPLRERREDIPVLTDQILSMLSRDMNRGNLRITESAREAMQRYSWPGNIRELRNVLERAALLSSGGLIQQTGLDFETSESPSFIEDTENELTIRESEKRQIIKALAIEDGNIIRAARRLGLPRSTLYAKIRRLGIPAAPPVLDS